MSKRRMEEHLQSHVRGTWHRMLSNMKEDGETLKKLFVATSTVHELFVDAPLCEDSRACNLITRRKNFQRILCVVG